MTSVQQELIQRHSQSLSQSINAAAQLPLLSSCFVSRACKIWRRFGNNGRTSPMRGEGFCLTLRRTRPRCRGIEVEAFRIGEFRDIDAKSWLSRMVNAVTIATLNQSSMCPEEVLQAQTFGIADRGRPIAETGYAVKAGHRGKPLQHCCCCCCCPK